MKFDKRGAWPAVQYAPRPWYKAPEFWMLAGILGMLAFVILLLLARR